MINPAVAGPPQLFSNKTSDSDRRLSQFSSFSMGWEELLDVDDARCAMRSS